MAAAPGTRSQLDRAVAALDGALPAGTIEPGLAPEGDVRAAVEGTMTRLLSEVLSQTASARNVTSRELFTIQKRIAEVSMLSQLIVSYSRQAFGPGSDDRGRWGLIERIRHMNALVTRQLEAVVQQVERYQSLAGEARRRCEQIQAVGVALREICARSRLVGLNSQIGAARVGTQGHSVAVIAREISSVSEMIGVICDDITRFAADMSEALSAFSRQTAQMSEITRCFADRLGAAVADAEQRSRQLEQERLQSLAAGDRCLASVQASAQQAESHLRFGPQFSRLQDRVDALVQELQHDARTVMDRSVHEPASPPLERVMVAASMAPIREPGETRRAGASRLWSVGRYLVYGLALAVLVAVVVHG